MANDKELGFDSSLPRNNVILAVGILSVITLAAIDPLLQGYFDHMVRAVPVDRRIADEEARAEAGEDAPLVALERSHRAKLEGAPVSISDAMGQLSERGRAAAGAPQPSGDVQAILGWNQLPNLPAATAAAQAGQGAIAAPAVDAGVPAEADAGTSDATEVEGQ